MTATEPRTAAVERLLNKIEAMPNRSYKVKVLSEALAEASGAATSASAEAEGLDVEAVRQRIEQIHRPEDYRLVDDDGVRHAPVKVCSVCRSGMYPQAWPCTTIAALEALATPPPAAPAAPEPLNTILQAIVQHATDAGMSFDDLRVLARLIEKVEQAAAPPALDVERLKAALPPDSYDGRTNWTQDSLARYILTSLSISEASDGR